MSLVHAIVATTLDGLTQSLRARVEAAGLASGGAAQAASTGTELAPSPTASTPTLAQSPDTGTAARFTDAALLAAELSRTPAAARVVAGAPLAVPGADAGTIAAALHDSIVTSGLFYESHVAAWAAGERSPETLAREPQAQLAEHPDLRGRLEAAGDEAPRSDAAPARSDTQPGSGAERAPDRAQAAMLARELVGQQLQLASDARFAWQGEPWPGQRAEVAIEREPREACERDAPPVWRTTVALELPQLGRIQAELRLSGAQVSVALLAHDAGACATLQARSSELAAALKASGLTAAAITVHRDARAD